MKTRLIVTLLLLLGLFSGIRGVAADELANGFKAPPDTARPWVWWF